MSASKKKDPELSFSRFLDNADFEPMLKEMTSSAAFRCVQAWLMEKPAVWAEADVASLAAALMVALTMRPRRLEEGDALVLRALEIMEHFDPLMWVIENPATGLLKTRPFMERLPWVDVTYSVQEADPTVDQHALETKPRAMQERQPVRRVGGREASEGRSRGASTHGGSA